MPKCNKLYQFSATHTHEPDFNYSMGKAIAHGILSDYDIVVPITSKHHAYVCLADLLLKQAGRFRRVLAYCNTVAEAKRFRMVLQDLGLAAWHINSLTSRTKRLAVMTDFAGDLQKPVHVLVTVEVLGEGINIPNADTCMFVEPRRSYRSIVQAIGRVLRLHPAKTIAHIVLPAVALGSRPAEKQEHQSRAASPSHTVNGSGQVRSSPMSVGNFNGSSLSFQNQQHKSEERGLRTSGQDQHLDAWRVGIMEIGSKEHLEAKVLGRHSAYSCQGTVTLPQAGPASDCQRALAKQQVRQQKSRNLEFSKSGKQKACLTTAAGEGRAVLHEGSQYSEPFSGARSSSEENTDCNGHPSSQTRTPTCHTSLNVSEFLQSNSSEFQQFPDFRIRRLPWDMRQAAPRKKQQVTFKSPRSFPASDLEYDTQVETFLAASVKADHRLVDASSAHRIQLVDCSLGLEGEPSADDALLEEVYGQLTMVLSQKDPWETRFNDLKAFVEQHGRLPHQRSSNLHEYRLGVWLKNQGPQVKSRQLSIQRLQQLMNASSPLIRRRLEGWISGDRDGIFQARCAQLGRYIRTHGTLPRSSAASPLEHWLQSCRAMGSLAVRARRKMLEEVHPLVSELLRKWDKTPIKVDLAKWNAQFEQLCSFVCLHQRLPKGVDAERGLDLWFRIQRHRLSCGSMAPDLTARLLRAHPLIAAAVRNAQQKLAEH